MTSLPDINIALQKIIGLSAHNIYVGHCGSAIEEGIVP